MDAAASHIESLARAFRAAVDAADRSSWGVEFERFPAGACGDTSLLLGQFLFEQGCGTFDYFSGCNEDGHHAWLEKENLIVDVTGDQFPDFGHAVYVGRDRTWHSRYTINTTHRARLDVFGPDVEPELRRVYVLILERLQLPRESMTGSST